VAPSSSGSDPNEPTDDAGRVRRLAELLWQRVERVRERAEREAQRLAQLVDAYGDSLGRPPLEAPAGSGESGELEEFRSPQVPETEEPASASESSANEEGEERNKTAIATADGVEQREALATDILEVFREKRSSKLRSGGHERVIRLAIYDLAVGRFGKQPDFGLLKRPHDRFDQLRHEFFEIFFAHAHHLAPDAGSG